MGSVNRPAKRAADDDDDSNTSAPGQASSSSGAPDSKTPIERRPSQRQRLNEPETETEPIDFDGLAITTDTEAGSSWLNDVSMPHAHHPFLISSLASATGGTASGSASAQHDDDDDDEQAQPRDRDSCHELQSLIQDVQQQSRQTPDGSITWSKQQVDQVVDVLQLALQTQLDRPLTKRDLFQLLNDKSTSHHPRAASCDKLKPAPHDPVAYGKRAINRLPMDVILVIVDHLKALAYYDPHLSYSHTQRAIRAWTEINSLARVNKMFRSCCRPICHSETLVLELKMLPNLSRRLQQQPSIALGLHSLHLQLLSFEDSRQAKHDYGFLLPDIIRQVPHLRRLCIIVDRDIAYSRPRNLDSFDDFTGGVRMSELIVDCLPSLDELVYGAPVSMDDIKGFLTLKDLRALDITGYVDPSPPSSQFKTCLPALRRFWCPTALFSVSQLHRLFLKSSRLTELAFIYDLDRAAHAASNWTQSELVDERLDRLGILFGTIGGGLKSLRIKTPAADDESEAALGRGFGAGFAPLLQAAITVAIPIAFGGGAGGFAAHGPGPAPQAGGNVPANLNRGAGGGGGGPPAGAAAGNPPPFAGQRGPPPGQHQQRFVFGGGAGGPGGGGMPQMGPNGNIFGGAAAPTEQDPIPFFGMIISSCPNLRHLELYGRRYRSSHIFKLFQLPLRHLTLTIPVNAVEQYLTIDAIAIALDGEEKGEEEVCKIWAQGLKQLELSNMGGEWSPAERRRVKMACDRRGIGFATTDSKSSLF
ncbi:hypothetical protein MVLG_03312 [Microbotryum lychnidis-dioicae p1A1 Lamole]|uniref:Uncharacterized protein n=1 Tax=Microbotryum lychnidis-dioicae (strain p1A1 Lamole / MvSl-1064) TaxID=683840 RepID=U5H7U2_USTV1|nr:hypothetical protein MVLG_03312 [Microbotryum lychnidis-dioicae p1A1 Lamole]|eukprot:KDE06406.1 hypothetical protein MVLG_03312 [Microbotryum lychnidis-dioicae p1A1 Lamole]